MFGLEERLAALITSSQKGRKHIRSISTTQDPQTEEQWEGGSSGEGPSASQAEKLLVQSLTEMVRTTFKLPLTESVEKPTSCLGSLKPPHALHAFPVHRWKSLCILSGFTQISIFSLLKSFQHFILWRKNLLRCGVYQQLTLLYPL
ncbi:hypothetical protein AB205_0093370, partial [Aquarana catesbeiana]